MANTDKIWTSIDALAAALNHSAVEAEEVLNQLQGDLMRNPRPDRDATRRKMIQIVANLSRLEARMMTAEGPLGGSQRV